MKCESTSVGKFTSQVTCEKTATAGRDTRTDPMKCRAIQPEMAVISPRVQDNTLSR